MKYTDFKQSLMELNVINQDVINNFLNGLAAKTTRPEVKNWITKNIRNYIINSDKVNREVAAKPKPTDPDWLKAAIQRGDKLYQFVPSRDFSDITDHIIDWLNSEQANVYLPNLHKVSYDQAKELSDKWTKTLIKKADTTEDETGIKNFMEFPDGWKFVSLHTKKSLDREGKIMQHCVGSYFNRVDKGHTHIYSLRDPQNNPHATIEVGTDKKIQQIRGKQNAKVVGKYVPYVREFVKKNNFTLSDYERRDLGFIQINKKEYDVFDLPDGLTVKEGGLDLSDYTSITKLPDNMTVNGDFDLSEVDIKKLPNNLKIVNGSLNLYKSPITEIPADLQLISKNNEGSLNLAHSGVLKMPDNFTVPGNLRFDKTPITKLPKGLVVKDALILDNSNIKELPADLQADSIYTNIQFKNVPKQLAGKIFYEK